MVYAGNKMTTGHYPQASQDQESKWQSNNLWEAFKPYMNVYAGSYRGRRKGHTQKNPEGKYWEAFRKIYINKILKTQGNRVRVCYDCLEVLTGS